MNFFLFASVIPAGLFLLALRWVEKSSQVDPEGHDRARNTLFFLGAVALALLLVDEVAAGLPQGRLLVFGMPILLLPTILSALALIPANLSMWRELRPVEHAGFVLIMLCAVCLLGLAFRRITQDGEILPASLIIVLVTLLAGRRFRVLVWLLGLLVLGMLAWLNNDSFNGQTAQFSQQLRWVVGMMFFALPGLAVALPAVLILQVLRQIDQEQPPLDALPARKIPTAYLLQMGFAGLILVGLAYTIYWSSVWDQTSDGMGGLFLYAFSTPVAIAAGILVALLTSGPRRAVGIGYLIAVPILAFAAFNAGWGVPYKQVTKQRAAQVERAIEQYHRRTGQYPRALNDLVPRDLIALPGPVMLRGEGWCYQGGGDQYRLGAFYREAFSAPLELKIYASSENPAGTWRCGERLAEMKLHYDPRILPEPVNDQQP